MTSVLLVSASSTAYWHTHTKAVLEAKGHTVRSLGESSAELAAADLTGIEVIVVVGSGGASAINTWLRDRWAAGLPIILGGIQTNGAGTQPRDLGLVAGVGTASSHGAVMLLGDPHPVTDGYTTDIQIRATGSWVVFATGADYGTVLGRVDTGSIYTYMAAVDVGDPINGSAGSSPGAVAPARAVFCGWLYAGAAATDYSPDAQILLDQAVEWASTTDLVDVTPTGPTWTDDADGGGTWSTPTEEGVTYTPASGTAGPGERVTVTASAQAGFRLVGPATTWSHRFAPLPPSPPGPFAPSGLVDPAHPLANVPVLKRLQAGALQGMVGDANSAVANGAFASTADGTTTYAREAIPGSPGSFRLSALVKVVKVSGQQAFFGVTDTTAAPPWPYVIECGYVPGLGLRAAGVTLLADADCVDGNWYRITLTWDNALSAATRRNQFAATAQNPDGSVPAGAATAAWALVQSTQGLPVTFYAKTNDADGAVKDLTYVGSMLGVADDGGLVRAAPWEWDGSNSAERSAIWAKGIAAPLKVVLTSGGSAEYGGSSTWGRAISSGWQSYLRPVWSDLADAGYTVLHTHALHEGWGADSHLQRQVDMLTKMRDLFGDFPIYYLGYSMGAFSAWRAILGRAGFPPIYKAYIVAGAIDLDLYDGMWFPQLGQRWGTAPRDSPIDIPGEEFIARGTLVRLAHQTGDANVDYTTTHLTMKGKYDGSPLFEERVIEAANHFGPDYWDSQDIIAFYDDAPAEPEPDVMHLIEWDGVTSTRLGLIHWDGSTSTPLGLTES